MVSEDHSPPHPSPTLRTIFVDTSIGTHLGIVVSLHDTISDVKAKIRAEHVLCFQDIGDISIQAVKVKRRGFFYNLADSMYAVNAFDGLRGSWFICIDATPIHPLENQEVVMSKVTHEHLEPHNSTVPVCCAVRHEGIVSSGLSPKNQDAIMNKLLAQDWNMVIHSISAEQDKQMSHDAYLKELVAEDGQTSQVLSVDELIPGDRNIKISNKIKVNEAHLHEDTIISPGINSGTDVPESHNPISMSIDNEVRPEVLIDREKDGEKKKYSKDFGLNSSDGMPSANHAHQKTSRKRGKSLPHVTFLESQSQHHLVEKKEVNLKDGVHEEHNEDHRAGSKFRRSENINESICNVKRETLSAVSEVQPSNLPDEDTSSIQNSQAEKQIKRRKRKSSKSHEMVRLAMSSEALATGSPKVTTNPYDSGKDANASKYPKEAIIYESLPNDDRDTNIAPDAANLRGSASQMEKRGHSMDISMPVPSSINNKSTENQALQVNPAVQSDTLPHHHSPVEKKRKKKKSSKFLAMPSETFVAQSSEVAIIDQKHSVKKDASISLENYPTEPGIDDSLPNDDRDMSIVPDAAKLIEISNQKEKIEHPMEICMAVTSSRMEPTEERIIQLNHVDQSVLAVDFGQGTDVGICLKEAEMSTISSLAVAFQTPIKLSCRETKFKNESSKGLEPMKSNDQQDMNLDARKFIPESNLKGDEAGLIDARSEAPSTSEKYPYQGQSTHATSKDSSGDKHQDAFKETGAAAHLEGLNKDRSCGSRKKTKPEVRHCRKKLKTESSIICESTQVNGVREHLNSDDAQVFLNDIQNNPNAATFIKEADKKANGGHCFDTLDKSSSYSKEVPGQSEFPAKPRRSRKKLKSELSNLGSPEITNVVLLKSNDEIKKSTELRGSDPSKLTDGSNLAVEQYSINSKVTVPLSGKDSPKQDEVSWVIPVDPTCSEHQVLNELSNAKVKTKEDDGTQIQLHGALAGPTKSKHDKKKSKNAGLKIHDSSEMDEHMEICRPVVGVNFFDYFVSKADRNCPDVPRPNIPSTKYEIRPKTKCSRKTEINRQYEGSHSDVVQFAFHIERQTQENDTSDHNLIAGEQDIATRDSKSGNARNRKKLSSKQKGHDKHKLEMKPQDYGPQLQVHLSKSGEKSELGRKITADGNVVAPSPVLNNGVDNMVYKDECVQHGDLDSSNKSTIGGNALGSNHCDVSSSGGKAYMEGSSDSTGNTPHEIKGYRVVRKVPRCSNKSNFENSSLAMFGRIFSDASDACFGSDNVLCKKKVTATTASNGVPTTTDSGMHLEEMLKKSSALKPQLNTHFSGFEDGI